MNHGPAPHYIFFASVAKKNGYMRAPNILTKTVGQEKGYAMRLSQLPQSGGAEIVAAFPISIIDNTS
jgi:rubrerythrin